MKEQLTVGSLFSGIGGLDLGLERAGMRVVWQSEIEPFACKVLNKHWKGIPNYGDIKLIDWRAVERPAVICGGYPCQPFSTAGSRKGEEDPRHLFPWVLQAISALRPRYAVLENVRGHLSLGGTRVLADLASIGYDAEWRIVSAASVGAPHRRDRIIIVAYPASQQRHGGDGHAGVCVEPQAFPQLGDSGGQDDISNADSIGQLDSQAQIFTAEARLTALREPAGCSEGAGRRSRPGEWEAEPGVGRMVDGVPRQVDRLRGLGNAVVPQVAEAIGRLIVSHYERSAQ